MSYTLTARQGGPEQLDDEADIEYRSATEKYTVAADVHDRILPLFLAAPKLLEACEYVAMAHGHIHDDPPPWLNAVRTALADAKKK